MLKVPSLIFLVLLRRKRTGDGRGRARSKPTPKAASLSTFSLQPDTLTTSTTSWTPCARRDSLNLHNGLSPSAGTGSVPLLAMLYSRFSSLSKRPKLEPDFLGRSFQIYSDETHYIVIRIQQGACRSGRTWATRGFSFFGRAWSDKRPTSFRCSSDCISEEAGLRWILDPSSRNRKSRRVEPS